ncbi:MAG: ArsR/SmtB family transcription factor [Candidatus Nanohaloarchaea archaeon]
MPEFLRRDTEEIVEAAELDRPAIKALTDDTRREMLQILASSPSYPAEIASRMDLGKQQAYYHFRKLEDAGLIEEDHEEKRSGGVATFYRPSADGYLLDLGSGGRKAMVPPAREGARKFLEPMVEEGRVTGCIVVGSPDEHGRDQVRAKDGHLAGEVGLTLGNYGKTTDLVTRLDTELVSSGNFGQDIFMVGGVLTNTVTMRFNDAFPASFSTDSFPYHELETPQESYTEDAIGVVQKAENPEEPGKAIYMAAGIRNRGTQGAIRALKDIEELAQGYSSGEFYRVVRGLDLDGDGSVDDYEVVEGG